MFHTVALFVDNHDNQRTYREAMKGSLMSISKPYEGYETLILCVFTFACKSRQCKTQYGGNYFIVNFFQ